MKVIGTAPVEVVTDRARLYPVVLGVVDREGFDKRKRSTNSLKRAAR